MTERGVPIAVGDGRPLRVATLVPHGGAIDRATRRALLAAGAEVVITMPAGDPRSFGERAQSLRDARPDVVVIALADRGDADRAALLVEALRFACAAQRPAPRLVVPTGDDGARARMTALADPFALEIVPDVRTDDGRRRLIALLRDLRREGAVLRDEALEILARRIAELKRTSALVVDVTDVSTSLVRAEPNAPLLAAHARPLGIGRGADHVVARAGLDRVRRWIPWTVDAPTLLDRVFDRARWPGAVPTDRETRALEIALAHEAIAHALADATAAGIGAAMRTAATITLTGRLASLAGERAVLTAIDALEVTEPVSIARDGDDALIAAAAAASSGDSADLDRAVAERAAPLAAVVPVATSKRSVVRIATAIASREERAERDALFVLRAHGTVEVSGAGVTHARVEAGSLGVVIDARPRPLTLPARDAERVPAVARWYEALGGGQFEAAPA